uniref:Uncharacterized protein n=1 Tax=Anguilla anguilla TaxID=7936 RepID=A0A0E9XRH3_ANGAN
MKFFLPVLFYLFFFFPTELSLNRLQTI